MASKVQHFQIIATAERAERVPKVNGAWYFGLPFVMDPTVTWADYFAGVEPRGFLVGIHEAGHAQEGTVYPLDLAVVNGADGAPKTQEIANFIGLAIEGTDYERDDNMTVALAGGVKANYIQQIQTGVGAVAAYAVDPAVTAAAPLLGIKELKGHLFWNTVQ